MLIYLTFLIIICSDFIKKSTILKYLQLKLKSFNQYFKIFTFF